MQHGKRLAPFRQIAH